MNTSPLVHVNLTLPKRLVDAARKKGSISKYTATLMDRDQAWERKLEAIEALKKLPPANPEIKDAAKYVHDMRQENEKRLKRLGI